MTPRYSALMQLVDYVEDPKHVAVGDLLCVDGEWKRVVKTGPSEYPGVLGWDAFVAGEHGFNDHVQMWKGHPVARIPGVLIELLNSAKDPYR